MGQAKRRGSKEERVTQAQARPAPLGKPKAFKRPTNTREFIEFQANVDRLVRNLTTPESINDQVSQFASTLSSQPPTFLNCEPELWSRDLACDTNVEKYIEIHGGSMLCGYRIWYNEPVYIEGERHAVWTDGQNIKDVSFCSSGETRILFVPDQYDFNSAPAKHCFAFDNADQPIAVMLQDSQRAAIQAGQMTPEEAWEQMLTYEQWLANSNNSSNPNN